MTVYYTIVDNKGKFLELRSPYGDGYDSYLLDVEIDKCDIFDTFEECKEIFDYIQDDDNDIDFEYIELPLRIVKIESRRSIIEE